MTRTLPITLSGLFLLFMAHAVNAQAPGTSCDAQGIGAVNLEVDGRQVNIQEVSEAKTGDIPYCLVKVMMHEAINIWVGLPMAGKWNGRWQSVGGGGYAGTVSAPESALAQGYAAAATDTGHTAQAGGSFGMLAPGQPNKQLQIDFAYRSEHMMAVIGKLLVLAFYGQEPVYSYWNGCSTGGRQGLRMAQDYPEDYNGILAGAPAIHWDRFQATQLWHQVVMRMENGGPIGGGVREVLVAKEGLATSRAIAACDALDDVTDGILNDPRQCHYSAAADTTITSAQCSPADAACLSPGEANAIDAMWLGPVVCREGGIDCDVPATAARDIGGGPGMRLWYGQTRGTSLAALGGPTPFFIATEQPKYWVYFDPDWDWTTIDYSNYAQFFIDSVAMVGPVMASDNPDLAPFRDRGGKLVMYHGWADTVIMPEGSIDYYERVNRTLGGDLAETRDFARLFMAPGVGHCAGGDGPQPQGWFEAVVDWVENGVAPETITAVRATEAGQESRPLCPYPAAAKWTGQGSTLHAANFTCVVPE